MAALGAQPLGGARAPANLGLVARFLQFASGRFCGLTALVYLGVCFVLEPSSTIHSAYDCFREACEPLGIALSPEKARAPAKSLLLLGASVTLDTDPVMNALP